MQYPNKKVIKPNNNNSTRGISYINRGMTLEEDINTTNKYYREANKALIHKKPIPVRVVDVHYPNRHTATITRAYYVVPSTTDYNGVYKGRHIDFEAKETANKTSFPLQNIHAHQIEHLIQVENHGGIAFILVHFSKHNEIFLLFANKLKEFVIRANEGGRKSIKLEEFREFGYLVETGYSPRIDYLKIIDSVYINKK